MRGGGRGEVGPMYCIVHMKILASPVKANGRENAKRVAQMLDNSIYGERPEIAIIH